MPKNDLKQRVLSMLLENNGTASGQFMCEKLGVTRAAVWKAIQQLEDDGVHMKSKPGTGYRIEQVEDKINESTLRTQLGTPFDRQIAFFEEVGSTNTEVRKIAENGGKTGDFALSLKQNAGRGRRGRSFFSPDGGLYLSMLFRPQTSLEELMPFTAFSAVAVRRAIQEVTGMDAQIKWTNDLVIGQKKVSGTITDIVFEGESGQVDALILGVGINVKNSDFPDEIKDKAISLETASGKEVSILQLAGALTRELDRLWPVAICKEREYYLKEYREHCLTLGKEVQVIRNNQNQQGFALDINDHAALVIRFADGHIENIDSGEVSVRGLYGYVDL